MKNKINLLVAVVVLCAIGMACNASFTTANISSFSFGKNDSATPAATSFELGDTIYAVAVVSNTSSKQKIHFKISAANVEGKAKGEELFKQDIDFEGARPVFLKMSVPAAGEYSVEATLLGEDGKEVDKKSGTFTVKGGAAPAAPAADKPAEPKKDDDDEDK